MGCSVKIISIVSPCYNESENIDLFYEDLVDKFNNLNCYEFEIIFIDNSSTDNTVEKIKELISRDDRVKLIVNSRNFGHIRSPFYALKQACGNAVILMASDLQDPPSLLPELIQKWESGYKVVKAVKTTSDETVVMFMLRSLFYRTINRLSDIELTKNFTGFGLYDEAVISVLKATDDPYPYFRGLISDVGFEQTQITFNQPRRKRGLTKNNFYTLYDIGMLGITNHTKIPLRFAVLIGFILGGLSFFLGLVYLMLKVLYWDRFQAGTAPILIAVFFFSAVQLFFLGLLGEYIGAIHTQVQKRPLVIEKERVNFDNGRT